ncbi:HPr kinase/phosphorylase [Fredinandcohnia quinoae]|uniref:Aldolase n=1 Tax=Fredinandcohnia quinoae TaxID=2918902 RepID=A0AAW5E0Y5_9BACI|nr:aldolase [Fredinandcohnia sp. SECRCQ15]MCH1626273.1 aldolase [Fredinandcohnia sp. SECRCQ15]
MFFFSEEYFYKVFGLTVSSVYFLPEAPLTYVNDNQVDIVITETDLSLLWADFADRNNFFIVEEDFIMFQVPDVAIFKIEHGNTILVSPYPNVSHDHIRLYLLGTCMGAILLQRKILPLHGSAVVINGKAYAIVGDSGAGKSTLASAFIKRGYSLLSDDVIAVTLADGNQPIVTPAYPQQKLWQESIDQFGMDSGQYRPVIQRETKFAIPVKEHFKTEPTPLAGVIELTKKENGRIEITPIQDLERLLKLFQHTYRNFLIARSGLMDWHFETLTKIVNKLDLYQIKRPTTYFTAHELVDLILAKLQKEKVR